MATPDPSATCCGRTVWRLEVMYKELAEAMQRVVGLLLRPDKSKLAVFGPTPEVVVSSESLAAIERVTGEECMRLLGDHIQVDSGFRSELRVRLAAVWKAFYLRITFWTRRGSWNAKLRMLHMAVWPVLSWCGGSRPWSQLEAKTLRTTQIKMSRRALRLSKRADESLSEFMRHSARTIQRVEEESKIP